ncbi:MAG TPA: M14 family metallopeptidase [Gemmatimonadaceae bacterium]
MRLTLACATILASAVAGIAPAQSVAATQLRTPTEFLGFEVGADRKLADYHQIVSYFEHLAQRSPRMELETMGETTLGNDFVFAMISSPENLRNRKRYQDIARRLADPRGLSQQQVDSLVSAGKAIILLTNNIHSTEIASSQMAMELAYQLVTATDPDTERRLNDVILLLVPSLNPDGQIMETEWYRKYVGTPYEGGSMPWLYHHYAGHDDNRDWYMLTQKETKAMTRTAYKEWYPQVWLDVHQMGSSGPRIFVPPYADPIAPAVSPLMWRGINLIGSNMAWRLEQAGKSGVVSQYVFDAYYPGSVDSNPEFKNIFAMIIELASARMATPIEFDRNELSGGGKGLAEYRVTTNFPNPWPGGVWRLRDIMDYELIAANAMLETVGDHPQDFMRGTLAMAREQIAAGRPNEYWRIPRLQRAEVTAARLAHLLDENGAEVFVTPSEFLIPTAQPYGKFIAELLGTQRYPEVRTTPGGPILRPYDVTTWSLPLLMGVQVTKGMVAAADARAAKPITDSDWSPGALDGRGATYALGRNNNNAYRVVNALLANGGRVNVATQRFEGSDGASFPAGTFIIPNNADLAELASKYHVVLTALQQNPSAIVAQRPVRIGLYKPWNASMDEGWTRFVLEQYGFAPRSIDNAMMKAGRLKASFDAIILPSVSKSIILTGHSAAGGRGRSVEELPPKYAGGIGNEGLAALRAFVDAGGTLITLAASGELVTDEMNLPVRNALENVDDDEFSVPGSLLRAQIDESNPINYGMPGEAAIFVDDAIAYATAPPPPGVRRLAVATYPAASEDILLSGWATGLDRLKRRDAAVAFTRGKGKVVMFGFRVQNRAQTEGTFKMLFNAILWATRD